MSQRYCLRGHDTAAVGRNAGRHCRECDRLRALGRTGEPGGARHARKNKLWVIDQKGGACLDCGFTFEGRPECAQLDHREGRTFSQRHNIYMWGRVRLTAELELCDLVCANCHVIRSQWRLRRG